MDTTTFEGVHSFEEAHVYKTDQTSENTPINTLISLVNGLESSFPENFGLQVQSPDLLLEIL